MYHLPYEQQTNRAYRPKLLAGRTPLQVSQAPAHLPHARQRFTFSAAPWPGPSGLGAARRGSPASWPRALRALPSVRSRHGPPMALVSLTMRPSRRRPAEARELEPGLVLGGRAVGLRVGAGLHCRGLCRREHGHRACNRGRRLGGVPCRVSRYLCHHVVQVADCCSQWPAVSATDRQAAGKSPGSLPIPALHRSLARGVMLRLLKGVLVGALFCFVLLHVALLFRSAGGTGTVMLRRSLGDSCASESPCEEAISLCCPSSDDR